jgi:osmotically-inducible protein OsmY
MKTADAIVLRRLRPLTSIVSGRLLTVALAVALATPGVALAQAGGAAGASPTTTAPAGGGSSNTPAGISEKSIPGTTPPALGATAPTTTSAAATPTAIATPGVSAPKAAPAHRTRKHRKAPAKPPSWVMQSKVQLALEADPRFKGVRATVTQPGVVVLEGGVFDNDAKNAAERTASSVEGVNRVINALTTNSLQWLLVQNRINQALQQNGLPLVSVKVIGKTAYISGQVSKAADKDRAVNVVNSTEPDITVGTNLINVVP